MLFHHQPRLRILWHGALIAPFPIASRNFTHPAQHRVAVFGLQELHHASLCSSSMGASSRIRAHWARPKQCSKADALDDSPDIFDEDAPLLSGVQLTEGLQHDAHTAADAHSPLCKEAAQVPSSLQVVLVSIHSSHIAAPDNIGHVPSMQQQSLLCHGPTHLPRGQCCILSHKTERSPICEVILSALSAAHCLCCRNSWLHL